MGEERFPFFDDVCGQLAPCGRLIEQFTFDGHDSNTLPALIPLDDGVDQELLASAEHDHAEVGSKERSQGVVSRTTDAVRDREHLNTHRSARIR